MLEHCFDLMTGVLISEQQVIIKVFLNILLFMSLRMHVYMTFRSSSAKIDHMMSVPEFQGYLYYFVK